MSQPFYFFSPVRFFPPSRDQPGIAQKDVIKDLDRLFQIDQKFREFFPVNPDRSRNGLLLFLHGAWTDAPG
jgi:hypothetical protein